MLKHSLFYKIIIRVDDLVKELQTFAKNEVAPYKYPRAIEFVDSLPKTNSGKIRRVELRDAERENIIKKMDLNNIDFNEKTPR